ncbi:MAG: hypothetical protein LBM07_04305 [Culturomica sp.]|jgi:hypothetical protein|nr:hypothetical protein [Culturomica sp.]
MGLPVHKTTRTPVPVPTNFPEIASFDLNIPSRITIDFTAYLSDRHKKPEGVSGAVVKWKVSDVPITEIDEFTNSLLDTKSPITFVFSNNQHGKTVYFALAWQNTKGEMGHFSPIQSSLIP